MNYFRYFIVLFLFTSYFSHASVLIIEASDLHSEYANAVAFYKVALEKRADFLQKNPGGQIVWLLNGDTAGISTFTDRDRGALSFKIFSQMAIRDHLVVVQGNHDGFDFNLETYQKQIKDFVENERSLKPGRQFHILSANIKTNKKAAAAVNIHKYFAPYYDLVDQGHKIRIVGMITPSLQDYIAYTIKDSISKVSPLLPLAQQQLVVANKENVSRVIFSIHESHPIVEDFSIELSKWVKANKYNFPGIENIKIDLIYAGHDHQTRNDLLTNGTRIIDSGSDYRYISFTEIDERNTVLDSDVLEIAKQIPNKRSRYPKNAKKALKRLKHELAVVETINQTPLGHTDHLIDARRAELAKAPHITGVAIADSLKMWAQEYIKSDFKLNMLGKFKNLPLENEIFGFFNSKSLRSNEVYPSDNFNLGQVKNMRAYADPAFIYLMKGEDILKIFKEIRQSRLKDTIKDVFPEHTPQTSSNLVEAEEYELKIFTKDGTTRSIVKEAYYFTAFDDFLGKQGFGTKAFSEAMKTSHRLYPKDALMQNILGKHFLKALNSLYTKKLKAINCKKAYSLPSYFWQL